MKHNWLLTAALHLAILPAMPKPLTWDSDDPSLTWDAPGLTWDGFVPEDNNPNPQTNTMLQDLIDLNLSDADWAEIDAALTTLETKLGANLLDLTTEQRMSLNKMGDRSEPFCRQSLIIGRQNAAELTARAAAALAKAEGDLAACEKLRLRLTRLTSLNEKANDSEMALGSDVMEYALFQYGFLSAIGAGAGLDDLYAQLGQRFAKGSPQPAQPAQPAPTPTPTPPA